MRRLSSESLKGFEIFAQFARLAGAGSSGAMYSISCFDKPALKLESEILLRQYDK